MPDIDITTFNANLLLTQAYCDLQLRNTTKNHAEILRSFNPLYNGENIFSFSSSYYGYITNWHLEILYNETVFADLFEKQLVHKQEISKSVDAKIEYEGKILVAEIDQTVTDGASEAESEGLIDEFDCPPIDTWFYQTKAKDGRLLFAWIPEGFTTLINNAIAVNVVGCFNWIEKYFPIKNI